MIRKKKIEGMFKKKNKPSKMIRKKTSKTIHANFGGHIPHVKNDCIKSSFRFKHMNTIWIDAGICNNCSIKPCEYFKAWKEGLR